MGRKKVYIEILSDAEKKTLEEGWKNGKSPFFRNRCQCILLSHQKIDVNRLSVIFSVTTTTIYTWLRNWKKDGILGLITQSGQGRKPILSIDNKEHVKVVEKAVKNAAEKGVDMIDEIQKELELEDGFSKDTLRRFLKKKTTVSRDFVNTQKRK